MNNVKRLKSISYPVRLCIFFLVSSLEALAAFGYLVSIPPDPKNSFIAGFSLPRVIVMGGMLGISLGTAALAGWVRRNPQRVLSFIEPMFTSRKRFYWAALACVIMFLFGWCLTFIPNYQFGNYGGYIDRLRPAAVWLAFFSFQAGVVLLIKDRRCAKTPQDDYPLHLREWCLTLAILLLMWGLVIVTGSGIKPDPLYWNQPGVPLLPGQVLVAWIIGVILLIVGFNQTIQLRLVRIRESRLDLLIFLTLWIVTAFLWVGVPFPGSFFAPGPYPPNQQLYPFSDAAKYDADAQFAFLGLGMNDGNYTDKPLYSTFLLLLHVVFGQRYDWIGAAQVVILAVFPALLYLLGKTIHSRAAGLIVAVLAVFQEMNSIAASQLLLSSNTRVLLSEVPTAVGLALFCYFMVRWLKDAHTRTIFPLLAGGSLGFCTLIRHNPWLLLVVVVGFSFVVYSRRKKEWMMAGLLFTLGMGLAIGPWMARSWYYNRTPFYFTIPLFGSFFTSRYYTVQEAQPAPTGLTPTPTAAPTRTVTPPARTITPGPTRTPRPAIAQLNENIKHITRRIPVALVFAPTHFFHNIVASVMVLPTSMVLDDLKHTVTQPASFWMENWAGNLTGGQAIGLMVNLALLGLGISFSWKRLRFAGLIPLGIYLFYYLSNGVARTSGGRYLVPVVWVVYFYFGLGMIQISRWAFGRIRHFSPDISEPISLSGASISRAALRKSLILLSGLLFVVGAALPVSESLFPRVFTLIRSNSARAEKWLPQGSLEQAGFQAGDLTEFLKDEKAAVLVGRVLYPRFYPANQGEPDRFSAYSTRAYPRLVFDMIGPYLEQGVVLSMAKPPESFPQGMDVVVLGCSTRLAVDALVVVQIHPEGKVYLPQSKTSLGCSGTLQPGDP